MIATGPGWFLTRPGRVTRPVVLMPTGRLLGTGDREARWAEHDGTVVVTSVMGQFVLRETDGEWRTEDGAVWLTRTNHPRHVTPVVRKPLSTLPCALRGAPTSPPNGKPSNKNWYLCDHPEKPLGAKVCSCMGCGSGCRGYEVEADEDSADASLFISGGIGDALTAECLLTPEERENLTTIYYDAPAASSIIDLFSRLPNYPKLKNHVRVGPDVSVKRTKTVAVGSVDNVPATLRGSREELYPRAATYSGSSFLHYKLADVEVPERYVTVIHTSTWCFPPGRAFDDQDWATCLAALDRYDLKGVVLMDRATEIPSHPRLVDVQGQLTLPQSVEVLKRGLGYLGIDSWGSVLAAKLFPTNRLSVKWHRTHAWENRQVYFAPRTSFEWLTPQLMVPPWT